MDSTSVKQSLVQQIQTESAIANYRTLIEKMQDNCFEKCIAKPGSSMSSSEQTCSTACIEKYINAWNQVNTTLHNRLRQEAASR